MKLSSNKKVRSTSGCTCTGVILTHKHVITFNTGDSRTLLIDDGVLDDSAASIVFATKARGPPRKLLSSKKFSEFSVFLCTKKIRKILSRTPPKDHKPDDPAETKRIEKSGGFVTLPPKTYIPRVNGQLALSRAFGDFQLKMSKTVEQVI